MFWQLRGVLKTLGWLGLGEASEEVTALLGLRGPGEHGMEMTYLAGIQKVCQVCQVMRRRKTRKVFLRVAEATIKENTGFIWNQGRHANICKIMQMSLAEWPAGRGPSW